MMPAIYDLNVGRKQESTFNGYMRYTKQRQLCFFLLQIIICLLLIWLRCLTLKDSIKY